MPTTAKVVADSVNKKGDRLTTLVLEYPRIIHSEFMTHRDFSRNASSSRAIPVDKQILRIENDPFIPSYWGANQKGMSAAEEISEENKVQAFLLWKMLIPLVVFVVKSLHALGVHKQLANRLLEPFGHIQVVVTATQWDNFFSQRIHPAAQPEIQDLAKAIKVAMDASTPHILEEGEWHVPFISGGDTGLVYEYLKENRRHSLQPDLTITEPEIRKVIIQLSVARAARVSYGLNERGWGSIEADLKLYDMLLTSSHWSPFEHIATSMNWYSHEQFLDMVLRDYGYPGGEDVIWEDGITHMDRNGNFWSGNFKGFVQYRQLVNKKDEHSNE